MSEAGCCRLFLGDRELILGADLASSDEAGASDAITRGGSVLTYTTASLREGRPGESFSPGMIGLFRPLLSLAVNAICLAMP